MEPMFVDTSAWSLAFRRDQASAAPEVTIVVTGLILQELLQVFAGPRARKDIIEPICGTIATNA